VDVPVEISILETAELPSVRASSTATAMDGCREDITELVREATEAEDDDDDDDDDDDEEEEEEKSFSLVALISLFPENDLVREAGGGGMN